AGFDETRASASRTRNALRGRVEVPPSDSDGYPEMTPARIRRDGRWRRGISRGARAPISSHRAWCLPCIASYAIMISFRRNSSSTSMDDLRRRFAYNGSMRRTRESARTLLDEAKLSASIARTLDEVRAAQRLRHRVFAEEMQARLETTEE